MSIRTRRITNREGENNVKRTLLLIMASLFLLTVSAFAIDYDPEYSGIIDTFTGQPIDETSYIDTSDTVVFDENTYYDRRDGMFVYIIPGTVNEIRSSVADCMITNGAVTIRVPEGMECTLYLEGQKIDPSVLNNLAYPGTYSLTVSSSAQNSRTIRFAISPDSATSMEQYWMPDHFRVSDVYLNGEKISSASDVVDFTQEGQYQITYYCVPTRTLYDLNVLIDHTPPTLTLEGVTDDVAKGPVTISYDEANLWIYIERDGEQIPFTTKLTQNGSYHITVSDEAGNVMIYDFVILVYFTISSIALYISFLLLGGVLVCYLIHARNHVRIR